MIQEYARQKTSLECSIWNLIKEFGFEAFDDLFTKSMRNTKALSDYMDTEFKLHFDEDETALVKLNYVINGIISEVKPIRNKFERKLNKYIKEKFNMKKEDFAFLRSFEVNTDKNNQKLEDFRAKYLNKIKKEDRDIFTDIVTYFMYKDLPFQDTRCLNCISEYVSMELEVDGDIHDTKLYEKYKNRRINEIAQYLGVPADKISTLFYDIINGINHTGFFEESENCTFPVSKETLFDETRTEICDLELFSEMNMLDPYIILLPYYPDMNMNNVDRIMGGIGYYVRAYLSNKQGISLDLFYDAFNEALDLSLLLNLRDYIGFDEDEREFKMSMIVRMAEIKDMNSFLIQVLYETFMNMSIYLYQHFLKLNVISEVAPESIQMYSEALDDQNDLIEEITEDKDMLEEKLSALKDENIRLKKNVKDKELENKKILAQMDVKAYTDEIDELKRKLDKMEKKCNDLMEEQDELKELRRIVMLRNEEDKEDEEKFDINKIDLNSMKNRRYIFFGGHYTALRKLADTFPKSKQYHTMPSGSINVTKTDMIIIFPNFINHPIYWAAIKLAKDNNIPFMFSTASNFENIIEDIVTKENEK